MPTAADGYLPPVLAAVFVGGAPTWGGIATLLGGTIGALTSPLYRLYSPASWAPG